MEPILAVTVPFFALILCGYAAARLHWLPESAIAGLNSFVLFFALPCMLFRLVLNSSIQELLDPASLLVWLTAALVMVALSVAFTRNARVGLQDAAFGALVAAFPNAGFMGVPLMVALMGPAGGTIATTTMLVDNIVTASLCIALAQAGASRAAASGATTKATAGASTGPSFQAALAQALRGVLSNPLPWAIALGALASMSALALPGPVDTVVAMLGSAATPVALFTIGAVLCRSGRHSAQATPLRDYLPVALLKLFLHPLLVWGLCQGAQALGLAMSQHQVATLTLMAALPSASNVALLAERYGANSGRIARIIMASTVLAFASFSALAYWFGAQPQ